MIQKFQDIKVLQKLAETHSGSTQIIVGKYQDKLIICKSMSKKSFKDIKSIEHINNQKEALKYFTNLASKGINKLIATFQDNEKLHMILEPVKGLPLHKLLKMVGNFKTKFTLIVISQVGLILREIHSNGFIYRDIKASNFMIDQSGRVTLIDLGHTKRIGKDRTYTICGTTHSIAPQVYDQKGYSYEFDYYGFGVLIYELLVGQAPFGYGNTNKNILQDMKKGLNQEILSKIQCKTTQDLISRLMAQPSIRLGSKNGFDQILQHDYFNVMEFCTAKDIYDGVQQLDPSDPQYDLYISEISDFGVLDYKYDEVQPNDPFYKFFV